ncbi:MAG TPA: hypothetical protein VMT50_08180 [Steroidobacteraceae bacterium]|nr:hypothetical protein [Steroidobacteraceae bacterium]
MPTQQPRTMRRRGRPAPVTPAARPLRGLRREELHERFAAALGRCDGLEGAHCVHELWMRGEIGLNIERMLGQLWGAAADTVPDWLPMRYVEWLPRAYEVAGRFAPAGRGRSNLYLVLLDYSDSREEPFGVYVGMSRYRPSERFDQHKAGIRAAGSVLQRGLEVLTGLTLHLQGLPRTQAEALEEQLAEALRDAGIFVRGGH